MLGEGEQDQREISSECSSGCQSGWTMYLDQSTYEAPNSSFLVEKGSSFRPDSENEEQEEDEDEEEDLSMISDASSGPPHFHEEDQHFYCYHTSNTCCEGNGCLCSALVPATDGGKKRMTEATKQRKQHQLQPSSSMLDDTASSPLFSSYSKNNFNENDHEGELDFSCGFSATHLKGKSALQSYLQYSSVHVKPNQRKPGSRKEDMMIGSRVLSSSPGKDQNEGFV